MPWTDRECHGGVEDALEGSTSKSTRQEGNPPFHNNPCGALRPVWHCTDFSQFLWVEPVQLVIRTQR